MGCVPKPPLARKLGNGQGGLEGVRVFHRLCGFGGGVLVWLCLWWLCDRFVVSGVVFPWALWTHFSYKREVNSHLVCIAQGGAHDYSLVTCNTFFAPFIHHDVGHPFMFTSLNTSWMLAATSPKLKAYIIAFLIWAGTSDFRTFFALGE